MDESNAQHGSEPDVANRHDDDEDDEIEEADEVEPCRIISVLAETNRRDRWTVAPSTSMFTVLARSHFDFRKVETDGDTVELTIVCVFGHITLVVPEGTKVQLSGFSFLASANSDVADPGDATSHLPKLVVNATTVFGRISIRTPNAEDLAVPVETSAVDLPVAGGTPFVGAGPGLGLGDAADADAPVAAAVAGTPDDAPSVWESQPAATVDPVEVAEGSEAAAAAEDASAEDDAPTAAAAAAERESEAVGAA